MYESRQFAIFSVTELDKIHFNYSVKMVIRTMGHI